MNELCSSWAGDFGFMNWYCFTYIFFSRMHIVYLVSGLWVYPIFNVLTLPGRVLFLIGSFLTGYVFYFVGEYFNRFLWGKFSTPCLHFYKYPSREIFKIRFSANDDKQMKRSFSYIVRVCYFYDCLLLSYCSMHLYFLHDSCAIVPFN